MLDNYETKHPEEDAIIQFIIKTERFTYADLKSHVPTSDWRRTNLINRLQRYGMLFMVEKDHNNRKVFTADSAAISRAKASAKRQSTIGQMWSAMRSLRSFTPDEILAIVTTNVPKLRRDYVQSYCSNLLKANYLTVEQTALHAGRPARYRLIRDTGPLAPTTKTLQCIVDGNTGKVAYVAGNRL